MVQLAALTLLGASLALAIPPAGQSRPLGSQVTRDDFFIVSEVNLGKHQVVMEEPTQITMTMIVNGKTVFMNEQGRAMPVADMRAGDTVFVTYERDTKGVVTALTIREGPMTVQELHRRYFHG
ncbi:MAG TPA: hypothetical protein VNJ52_10750 [Patescibacteria group bacterium]|nr:hypothetical protein [Patescibacteria group bacterium]